MIEPAKLLDDAVKLISIAAAILKDNAAAVSPLREPAQSLWSWLEDRLSGDDAALELLRQIRQAPANPELGKRLKQALAQHLAEDHDSRVQLVKQLGYLVYLTQHASAATHNHMENNSSIYGPIIQNLNGGTFNYYVNAVKHTPPKKLTSFPTVHPDDLIGRTKDLAELTALLARNGKVVLVNGMGGIGKTSLAAAYIAQEYDNYQHIAWIAQSGKEFTKDKQDDKSGDVVDAFVQDRDLIHSLGLQEMSGKREEIFRAILRALRSINERPKLLVIDNADASIQSYLNDLPAPPNWHVLLTSREEIDGPKSFQLGFLEDVDAVKLFKIHCSRISDDKKIKTIVETVDYHTLTIEILARTAQRHRTTFPDLLNAIKNNVRANVPTKHSDLARIERVRTYLETIFDFSQLDENERWLLKQFVALPPEFQSYELLVELIEPEESDRGQTFSELLESLADKGWLLRDTEREKYKMHRVVREAIQDKLEIAPLDIESLLTNVTRRLSVDQTKDNPVDKFVWIPYGEAVETLVGQFEVPMVSHLQNNLGWVLQDFGAYSKAKDLLERALASDEKNLGADHPTTATSCSNLALVLQDLGDYESAKSLLERSLATNEKNLGADHPTTAASFSNLAGVLQSLGDYAGAKTLLERALASDEKNLGADHPTTASSCSNLALVLQDLGEYESAKSLLERALASSEQNLGADHPTTAVRCSNLASLLFVLSEYDRSRELTERTLEIEERAFGTDHPSTALTFSNLAVDLEKLGEFKKALSLASKALSVFENKLPAGHPHIEMAKRQISDLQAQNHK